jgi:hypothetical protein
MAAHRFKRNAGWIVLQFVIARDDADLAGDFDAHLRRARHVSGWMQRYARTADPLLLSKIREANPGLRPESHLQNSRAAARRQVTLATASSVIAVSMRYDSSCYRTPRVDVKVPRCAVQTAGCFFKDRHVLKKSS